MQSISDKAAQFLAPYVNGEASAWFEDLLKNPADRFVRG